MGFKKILSIVFQIPVWLILVGALITSIFAWLLKIQDINFWTPLILLIAIILYIIGRWFIKEENESAKESITN